MDETTNAARALIEWYWSHGKKRKEEYRLLPETWLAQLYDVHNSSARLSVSAPQDSRAALALWGPSQTGKSVMLSSYIDAKADKYGKGSALDWGTPVRFSIPHKGSAEEAEKTITLNPFNAGMDGSGCITRFTMVNPEEPHGMDLEHPVKLDLATPAQILHALAAGYASECKQEIPGKSSMRIWDKRSLTELLDGYDQGVSQELEPDRSAYELLHEVIDILKMLREASIHRYAGLPRPGEGFEIIREKILQCRSLLASRDKVVAFAAVLFWEGGSKLTEIYDGLRRMRDTVQGYLGGKGNIHCSFEVAHLFLDISTYAKIVDKAKGSDSGRQKLSDQINALSWKSSDDGIIMTHESGGGQKLVRDDIEFAYLQGIVWKLQVPLREDHIKENSPTLHKLLTKADIVDFPGVSNVQPGAEEDMLSPEELSPRDDHDFFTAILKRGKTSSIVASTALDCDLDGFSILVRVMVPPGKPDQLANGINVWWRTLTGKSVHSASSRDLPLNLIVTFFGNLLNNVCMPGGPDCLPQALESLQSLGKLSDPKILKAFATNYHFVRFAHIISGDEWTEEQMESSLAHMKRESSFKHQFGDRLDEVLNEMVTERNGNGGVEYVLKQLIQDADQSPRRQYIEERREENLNELQASFLAPFPPTAGDESAIREELLDKWKTGLKDRLEEEMRIQINKQEETDSAWEDSAKVVTHDLRKFINVNPDILEPLPSGLGGPGFRPTGYVKRQLKLWKDSKGHYGTENLRKVGVDSIVESQKLLQYFIDAVNVTVLADWINDVYGQGESTYSKDHRNHLAIRMIRELFPEIRGRKLHNRVSRTTFNDLLTLTRLEREAGLYYTESPHYEAIIEPLHEMFERLKNQAPPDGRGEQPGDGQLRALAESHPVLEDAVN